MSQQSDPASVQPHTIRLELDDEPGELLRALRPIADNGGNLLSVFHERGNLTPRGRIPVEVDLECPPDRFEDIVSDLRESGVTVSRAGTERYRDAVTVLLVGDLVAADLSETLSRVESRAGTAVSDLSLRLPEDGGEASSARLRIAVGEGRTGAALDALHEVAAEKDLRVVEPAGGSA